MKKFIGRFFAIIGFLTILVAASGLFLMQQLSPQKPKILDDSILVIKGATSFVEGPIDHSFLTSFQPPSESFYHVLYGIQAAKDDPKIQSIVLELSSLSLGLAQIEEIHAALKDFRNSGKKIYAYATQFGDLSSGTKAYYLASIANEIWMQPFSGLNLTGFHVDQPYLGKLLDHYHVKRQVVRRSEFKNAFSFMTEEKASEAEREAMEGVLGKFYAVIMGEIESGREMPPGELKDSLATTPLLSDEKAVEHEFIDHLGYLDEFLHHVQNVGVAGKGDASSKVPKKPALQKPGFLQKVMGEEETKESLYGSDRFLSCGGYGALKIQEAATKVLGKEAPKVALIYGSGMIVPSDEGGSPLASARNALTAKDMQRHFDAVFQDPFIKAIVLRLDTPGGSAVASESIRRLVLLAKSKNIPVVASFGNVSASGGYWIGAACDKILASRLTITGSIGTLAGKVSLKELLEDNDIHVDEFKAGANGEMWSLLSPYTEPQLQALNKSMDLLYARFVKLVSEGRGLSLDHVSEIAKGRVWSGSDAKTFGLVDQEGGLLAALSMAKELGDAKEAQVVEFPREQSFKDSFVAFFKGGVMSIAGLQTVFSKISGVMAGFDQRGVKLLDERAQLNYD